MEEKLMQLKQAADENYEDIVFNLAYEQREINDAYQIVIAQSAVQYLENAVRDPEACGLSEQEVEALLAANKTEPFLETVIHDFDTYIVKPNIFDSKVIEGMLSDIAQKEIERQTDKTKQRDNIER